MTHLKSRRPDKSQLANKAWNQKPVRRLLKLLDSDRQLLWAASVRMRFTSSWFDVDVNIYQHKKNEQINR